MAEASLVTIILHTRYVSVSLELLGTLVVLLRTKTVGCRRYTLEVPFLCSQSRVVAAKHVLGRHLPKVTHDVVTTFPCRLTRDDQLSKDYFKPFQ